MNSLVVLPSVVKRTPSDRLHVVIMNYVLYKWNKLLMMIILAVSLPSINSEKNYIRRFWIVPRREF